MAHGAAVKAYRETGLTAEIGVTLNMNMYYPFRPENADVHICSKIAQLQANNLFGDPIMKGSYPQELFDYLCVARRGAAGNS